MNGIAVFTEAPQKSCHVGERSTCTWKLGKLGSVQTPLAPHTPQAPHTSQAPHTPQAPHCIYGGSSKNHAMWENGPHAHENQITPCGRTVMNHYVVNIRGQTARRMRARRQRQTGKAHKQRTKTARGKEQAASKKHQAEHKRGGPRTKSAPSSQTGRLRLTK